MASSPLRVIQWTTGNIGRRSLHAILARPDMDLVGVYAHSADKAGVDAGELAHLDRVVGISATDDIAALIALEPDACVYNPLWSSVDELVRLLEAGINVCTSAGWINGRKLAPEDRDRIEKAALNGHATIFGSGAHPGMTNLLGIVTSAACERVDAITITESVDCSTYASKDTQVAMGFSRDPATPGLADSVRRESEVFAESVAMMADALDVPLDEITFEATFTAAHGDSDLGFMTIPAGTVGAVQGYHRGWSRGRPVINVGFQWTMGDQTDAPFKLAHGHVVRVDGMPNLRTVLRVLPPADWDEPGYMGLGMIYTAMPVVNAVPAVVAAPPGIATFNDLPLITGRAS